MEMDPLLRPQTVDEFLELFEREDEEKDLFGKIIHTLNKPL